MSWAGSATLPAAVCHRCGEPATCQWPQHLPQADYDRLPDTLKPIDGYAVITVHGCDDHELMPFCEHSDESTPPPCPTCRAVVGEPCVRGDGTPIPHRYHADRPLTGAAPAVPCRHAHRDDCPGYGACQCSAADPLPRRQPASPPPASAVEHPRGLVVLPINDSTAAAARSLGVNPERLTEMPAFRSGPDGALVACFTQYQVDTVGNPVRNEHGWLATETIEVPIKAIPGYDPTRPVDLT